MQPSLLLQQVVTTSQTNDFKSRQTFSRDCVDCGFIYLSKCLVDQSDCSHTRPYMPVALHTSPNSRSLIQTNPRSNLPLEPRLSGVCKQLETPFHKPAFHCNTAVIYLSINGCICMLFVLLYLNAVKHFVTSLKKAQI